MRQAEELSQKESIRLGGIVTNVRSGFQRDGKPCGFVTIEDFESSGEIAFFGESWGQWSGRMAVGYSLFITMKCSKKYKESNYYTMEVTDVKFLSSVKDEAVNKLTISIPAIDLMNEGSGENIETNNVVEDLNTLITKEPGPTELYIELIDAETAKTITLRAKDKISVHYTLIEFIKQHDGWNYNIN